MNTASSFPAPLGGGPEESPLDEINWVAMVVVFFLVAIALQWEGWKKDHERSARLEAYRRRDRWRQADVPRLLKLGIPRQRIERILNENHRRGRGVVQDYQSLDEMSAAAVTQFAILLAPETPGGERLKVLKQTAVWRYVVEALYRGEHAAAKAARLRSPSTRAEQAVSDCLGISEATVHKICVSVRQERRHEDKPADGILRISEFKAWQESGRAIAFGSSLRR